MPFALAPGISFCDAGGRRIFLDLRQDRYFCLGPDADAAFSRLVDGAKLTDEDNIRLETLRRGGILVVDDVERRPQPCQRPSFRLAPLDGAGPAIAAASVGRAAISVAKAKLALRCRSLDRLCGAVAASKTTLAGGCRSPDLRELTHLAFAFQASGRIWSGHDQCLARSLAIAGAARRRRIAADLLFGVRLRPFQAHAWVVADGILLSDRSDLVDQFTAILVI